MSLLVSAFFHPATHSYSYVVTEPCSRTCAIIDPVLDFDAQRGVAGTGPADEIVAFVKANDLIVEWLLETHVHADHLSAARYLKTRFVCAQNGIGAGVIRTRALVDPALPDPASGVFDRLFEEGDRIVLGHATGRVMATPGHTPSCVCYHFDNLVFTGDTLLMPEAGSGRCDFPGGDARMLYQSAQRVLALPGGTRVLVGHDYGTERRPPTYLSTVAAQRSGNRHLGDGRSEADFVALRRARDAELDEPALMDPAVRYNLSGGTQAAFAMEAPGDRGSVRFRAA